jgi:uncharacterized membrane protein
MTMLMNRLLTDPVSRSLTLAAFFGLILGSALMVSGSIRVASKGQLLRCLLAGVAGSRLRVLVDHVGQRPATP